ncbi:MAG: MarR family transcriptional regulator [Chloroflexi bacterium]|nr:MarR family transcriptional regulator [Chloroflexota bacterium]
MPDIGVPLMPEDLTPLKDEDLERAAGQIEEALRVLIQRLRQHRRVEIAASGLTLPQVSVLVELMEADGLSLNDLSQRMRLAHSTVSGIVDRLERREMVERRPDPMDRRFIRIHLTEPVRTYVREVLPVRRLGRIMDALRRVQPEELEAILKGLTILCRMLEAPGSRESDCSG